MAELGIPNGQIGLRTPVQGDACFIPLERTGGGDGPAGGMTLDSGVLNPELLGELTDALERVHGLEHRQKPGNIDPDWLPPTDWRPGDDEAGEEGRLAARACA
jgi:hypothetical protein